MEPLTSYTIGLKLPISLYREFKEKCFQQGHSMSRVLRALMEEWLKSNKS